MRDFYRFREQRQKQKKAAAQNPEAGERGEGDKRPDAGSPRSIMAAEIEARTKFAILTDVGSDDRGALIGWQRPGQRRRELAHVFRAPDYAS